MRVMWWVFMGMVSERRGEREVSGVLDEPVLEGGGVEVEEVACEGAGEPWDAVGVREGAGEGGGESEPCGAVSVVDEGSGAAGPLGAVWLGVEGGEGGEGIVGGACGEPEDVAGGGGGGGLGERG
jgi:hypothetical protein